MTGGRPSPGWARFLLTGSILLLPTLVVLVLNEVRRREFDIVAADIGWAIGTFQSRLREKDRRGGSPSDSRVDVLSSDADQVAYRRWAVGRAGSVEYATDFEVVLLQEHRLLRHRPEALITFRTAGLQSIRWEELSNALRERRVHFTLEAPAEH